MIALLLIYYYAIDYIGANTPTSKTCRARNLKSKIFFVKTFPSITIAKTIDSNTGLQNSSSRIYSYMCTVVGVKETQRWRPAHHMVLIPSRQLLMIKYMRSAIQMIMWMKTMFEIAFVCVSITDDSFIVFQHTYIHAHIIQ